ncbi:MAG: hypothetical protein QOC84_1212, partial [Bradyrhizobium sp.]|nr:hypothetical protein [Bradyrhizobium sp.]
MGKDVDARHKAGHDELNGEASNLSQTFRLDWRWTGAIAAWP